MITLKTFGIATAVAVLLAAGSARAVPVFANGDMESSSGTTLTGWTTGGSPEEGNARYGGGYGAPVQGTKWAWLGNFEAPGSFMEQTLAGFTVGSSYVLSFLQSSEYFASDSSTVAIIGASTLTNTFTTPPTFTSSSVGNGFWNNWLPQSWTFTADASSLTFHITGQDGPYDTGLDAFTLSDVSRVPVPAALPLLLAALGGLGFAARRRKVG